MTGHERQRLDFELPNVGQGSETVQAADIVADGESLLAVLLGSHYCSRSRELVRRLCARHEAFRRRETTVVPVLPDIRERARVWDRQYGLPFPMLADPAEDYGDADSGAVCGRGAFGAFEPLEASLSSLPAVALCRSDEAELAVVATETEAALDVPVVESLLGFLDCHATDAAPTGDAPVDG
ncbi:redoxin domain-containing protein [Haloarcula onubensis]|uniref:Peroxiredoxin family protein n=1 Tax=Haloarcula onubensis TaxID=2950539 RepID=A0ABU2FQL4_9EURY|nr:redoxin domain-containing protein [Halomicroarcula sp. S3CR25-11]MDS0282566.1 peroxiredoxin family protein [Halomicroarcula sp. S3CR25-11]